MCHSMPSLTSIILYGKRYRRLSLLVLLLLTFFILTSIHWDWVSNERSEAVLRILSSTRLEGSANNVLVNDNSCAEYFRILAMLDSEWYVRSFGDSHTSRSSRKHVLDSVRHMRVFGHCYIQQSSPYRELGIREIEDKLFPLFTGIFPAFKRWDGLTVEGFPSVVSNTEHSTSSHTSFWRQIQEKMKGRGVVMSVGESGVSDAKRLLRVLRALQNELPIQLVHKGDLSEASIQELVKAGRDPIRVKVGDTIHDLKNPQELWFVDAEKSVKTESSHLFRRFSNKWIASLFNSFEEMILMDTDAVLFVEPAFFFKIREYMETGAFFFKDRLIDEYIKRSDLRFYKKLLPSKMESSVFDFEPADNVVKQNDFFQFGYKHVMESGVVVLRRGDHLPGLLISTALHLWKETNDTFYGDKELFWLGQSIAGTSRYRFNKNSAAALGILTQNDKEKVTYTCSAQPGHFDGNNQLLWLNGGARYCKLASWDFDYSRQKSLRKAHISADSLKEHYESPIDANGAIIPARSSFSLFQKIFGFKSGFQKTEKMGCAGYVWCAYNRADRAAGATLEFTPEEISRFKFVVNVWNTN